MTGSSTVGAACEYAARKAYTLASLNASSLLSTAWNAPSVSDILTPCDHHND